MKTIISKKVSNKVAVSEILDTLNTKLGTNFTVVDFNNWKDGKYSQPFNEAVKSYVCTKGCRIAAALGAMAAQLKLVEAGVA